MSVLALHLWREWREHRFALLSLAVALPLGTWLLSLALPRGYSGDPLFHSVVAMGFALVLLVAVGGELLGAERRGMGLRWLERLPSGLAIAFRAKLAFFFVSLVSTTAYGYGVACLIGLLRHVRGNGAGSLDMRLLMLAVLVLGLWTFASSAWALGGGLAIIAAALVLVVIGFPIWRVIDLSYQPTQAQILWLAGLLVVGGVSGAWLAFVQGARHGRSVLASAALGLAPGLALAALTTSWSAARMIERESFDLGDPYLTLSHSLISNDGRVAFLVRGRYLAQWGTLPTCTLRVDLEHGTSERLGSLVSWTHRYHEADSGLYEFDELEIAVAESATPFVFDTERGERLAFATRKGAGKRPTPVGLGQLIPRTSDRPSVIRDPFRGRDYPLSPFEDLVRNGWLRVRPGRWLVQIPGSPASSSSELGYRWEWLDPDTGERSPVDWPDNARALVLFKDGRILLASLQRGLQVVHPEHGSCSTLDTQGVAVDHISIGWRNAPFPGVDGDTVGPIVLSTREHAWLVLDHDATSVRRLAVPDSILLLHQVGPGAAIVQDWRRQQLARLDLLTGEIVTLWPRD